MLRSADRRAGSLHHLDIIPGGVLPIAAHSMPPSLPVTARRGQFGILVPTGDTDTFLPALKISLLPSNRMGYPP